MRKITLLLVVMMSLVVIKFAKAETIKTYFVNTDFTSVMALPTGWTSTNDANYSLFGTGASTDFTTTTNQLNFIGTTVSNKNRGARVKFISSGANKTVYLDFDWKITTATVGAKNALGLFIQDSIAAQYTSTGDIMILYCSGSDGFIHCQNLDNTSAVFQNVSASGSFLKSGADAATCNTNNSSTKTTCAWAVGQTIHVTATLDFNTGTNKITYLKLTNTTTNTTSYENQVGFNFIGTPGCLSKISITDTYQSTSGTGSMPAFTNAIDNLKTYKISDIGVLGNNSPQCINTGVTLTCPNTPPTPGQGIESWYWQSSPTGTDKTHPAAAASPYTTYSSGTYYVRSVRSGVWGDASIGIPIIVTSNSVGGTAAADISNVLVGASTIIRLTGYTGAIQWQSSGDGSSYSDISGATSDTYTTPGLTPAGTYYYRAKVSTACTAYSSAVTVTSSSDPIVNASSWVTGNGYFTQVPGSNSANQTFTVSGSNLSADITLTPPANFEISSDGTNFVNSSSSITLTQSSGVVNSTTIYVRLVPTDIVAYSGNITIATTGGTTQNVAVSGHGVAAEPSTQPNSPAASNILQTSMSLGWTAGSGAKSIVLYSTNSDIATAHPPVDGTTYTTGGTTASGYIVGYVGTASSATITGLTANTTYNFAIFTFDDGNTAGAENYNVTSPATIAQATLANSNSNDDYRTRISGTWNVANTWESTPKGTSNWHIASCEPQTAANSTLVTAAALPVTITSDILPTTGFSMENNAKVILNPTWDATNHTFSNSILGNGGLVSLEIYAVPTAKTYIYTYNPGFSGISTVNYILSPVADNIRVIGGGGNYNVGFGGSTIAPTNTQFNVTTTKTSGQCFSIANDTYLQNSKVNLGDYVNIARTYSQSGPTSTYVGELASSASSVHPPILIGGISGNNSRTESFYIGGLNTDATYGGQFSLFGSNVTYAPIDIHKIGTGIWTLTGSANSNHYGGFYVDYGKVVLNGAIGAIGGLTSTVASGATLDGSGTLNGTATVNGTLQGSVAITGATTISSTGILSGSHTFGSTLSLAGTTNLTVTDFSGNFDVLTVTGAVTCGGVLNLTLPTAAPAVGTSIRIINAGTYNTGSFSSVPNGYSYNETNGYLTYNGNTVSGTTTNLSTAGLPVNNASITVSSGELVVDQNASVNTITVAPGAKLTLNSGNTLASTNGVVLQSDPTIGTATYVDNTPGTGLPSIAATVNQAVNYRTWYTSSPVTSGTLTGMDRIKSYYEYDNSWPLLSGNMVPGTGYLVVPANNDISGTVYSGTLNNGDIPVTLTTSPATNTASSGFNLVGNPYPSYLDWKLVTADVSNASHLTSTTMWYRTKVGSTYTFWTVNGAGVGSPATASYLIPPMQAFWVQGAGDLTFKNSMRSHNTTASPILMKAPAANTSDNQLIRLQVSNGSNTDEAVLYFNANSADGLDAYDSPKKSNENAEIPEIYTTVENKQLVINGMNRISLDKEIPVGFVPGSATSLSIQATELTNLPTDVKVLLMDKVSGSSLDLTAGTAQVLPDLSSASNQYSIVFRSAGVVSAIESIGNSANALVYRNANNQITVKLLGAIGSSSSVTVYNALGQKLLSQPITSTITVINNRLTAGVCFVKTTVDGKDSIRKIVLN